MSVQVIKDGKFNANGLPKEVTKIIDYESTAPLTISGLTASISIDSIRNTGGIKVVYDSIDKTQPISLGASALPNTMSIYKSPNTPIVSVTKEMGSITVSSTLSMVAPLYLNFYDQDVGSTVPIIIKIQGSSNNRIVLDTNNPLSTTNSFSLSGTNNTLVLNAPTLVQFPNTANTVLSTSNIDVLEIKTFIAETLVINLSTISSQISNITFDKNINEDVTLEQIKNNTLINIGLLYDNNAPPISILRSLTLTGDSGCNFISININAKTDGPGNYTIIFKNIKAFEIKITDAFLFYSPSIILKSTGDDFINFSINGGSPQLMLDASLMKATQIDLSKANGYVNLIYGKTVSNITQPVAAVDEAIYYNITNSQASYIGQTGNDIFDIRTSGNYKVTGGGGNNYYNFYILEEVMLNITDYYAGNGIGAADMITIRIIKNNNNQYAIKYSNNTLVSAAEGISLQVVNDLSQAATIAAGSNIIKYTGPAVNGTNVESFSNLHLSAQPQEVDTLIIILFHDLVHNNGRSDCTQKYDIRMSLLRYKINNDTAPDELWSFIYFNDNCNITRFSDVGFKFFGELIGDE